MSGVSYDTTYPLRTRSGQYLKKKANKRPLMCVPSWSWSVMMATRVYRSSLRVVPGFCSSRPSAVRMSLSSRLSMSFLDCAVSLNVFRILPRSGKMPNKSFPRTLNGFPRPLLPERTPMQLTMRTAQALALSPSQRMSVMSVSSSSDPSLRLRSAGDSPAKLASSNFSTFL